MILLALGYGQIWVRLNGKVLLLERELVSLERQIGRDLKVVRRDKVLTTHYQEVLRHFRQTDSDDQTMSCILSDMADAVRGSGVALPRINPQRIVKDGHTRRYSVDLTLNGELIKIFRFIHALQDYPRVYVVDELRVERDFSSADTVTCRMTISKTLFE